jgi:hypothetical protein
MFTNVAESFARMAASLVFFTGFLLLKNLQKILAALSVPPVVCIRCTHEH